MKTQRVFKITLSAMMTCTTPLSPSPWTKRGVGCFYDLMFKYMFKLFSITKIFTQYHILCDDHHNPPPPGPRDGVSPLPAEHFDSFLQLFVLPISTQTSAIQYYHHYHLTLFCRFPLFDATISTGPSYFLSYC